MSRTRAALIALSLIPVLLGAGCSDDDPEPKFGPPSSEAPTSPSTTAAAALRPEETVRAWVDARNLALRSGETNVVEALSADECQSCENSIQPIRQVHADGGHFDTVGWEVVSTRVKSQSSTRARVSAAITYAAGTTVPSSDASPVTYDVERHIVIVDLVRAGDRWQVRLLGYLS